MSEHNTQPKKSASIWAKILLILGGVGLAYLLVTLVLAAFPGLISGAEPYEREQQGVTVDMLVKITDGDMFAWFPGRIKPPDEDSVLEHFTLAWDSDGFRVPARAADHYPIAAFGDSFTEAANVPFPWPDKLAEDLNVPVYNYGYRDYGPLEVSRAVTEFAPTEARTWVLYAYFSGNDLINSNRSQLIEERSPFFLMPHLAARVAGDPMPTAAPTAEHYDFPWPVIIGGSYYEMVFFPSYLWAQLAPEGGFEATKTFEIAAQQLDVMEQAVPEDTCLGLIFTPTKEELYYPFIYDRQWLHGVGQQPVIDDDGYLQYADHPYASDDDFVMQHRTDQHDAILKLVAEHPRWHLIDLQPAFEAAVNRGDLLYYRYDSHWNQAGHDLAAQVIAEAMQNVPDCPLE